MMPYQPTLYFFQQSLYIPLFYIGYLRTFITERIRAVPLHYVGLHHVDTLAPILGKVTPFYQLAFSVKCRKFFTDHCHAVLSYCAFNIIR